LLDQELLFGVPSISTGRPLSNRTAPAIHALRSHLIANAAPHGVPLILRDRKTVVRFEQRVRFVAEEQAARDRQLADARRQAS
jgi:hypothetical protein